MVAISIVIPVYNIEKYLKECLDSIIDTTVHRFVHFEEKPAPPAPERRLCTIV